MPVAPVRSWFPNGQWATCNMPEETRKELDALISHQVRCLDFLELESTEGLPLDIWKEVRDELGDALCGKFQTAELAALAFVVQRHRIPKQYLFDMVNAADYWIRFRKFQTWEQLETFASNLGGSAMVAASKLVGVEPHFEEVALECGKAIFLTQRLASCVSDLKANRNFLPQEGMDRFGLDVHRIKMKQNCPEFKRFVRFYVSRLEKLFLVGSKLIPELEFDGARTLTSILCVNWRMLTRMRIEPESIFNPDGVLSRRDWLALKSRHLLGLEGGIPILDKSVDHH